MDLTYIALVISVVSVAISFYSIVSTRRAEIEMLKINFLLPHLCELSEKLTENTYPFRKKVDGNEGIDTINWVNEQAEFWHKKIIILQSLGVGAEVDLLLSGKGNFEEIKQSLQTISRCINNKYRELIKLNSEL